ncbi:MAG: amino acid--tRNA ligase-related protein, partial [Candidatus Phytoplasma australasiaticum]|nr:amino acid--tRNA ligase-related protein [Candidatus Phytoplasma australasiaticum]
SFFSFLKDGADNPTAPKTEVRGSLHLATLNSIGACNIPVDATSQVKPKDKGTENEKYLTEVIFKKPIFVTNWPKNIKAFYMRNNSDNETVAAMDLLVPKVGELVGGSQREERFEVLQDKMKEMQINKIDLDWYLDLRRFGSCIHSGFGLGFERMLLYLTGLDNIRDVIAFPRSYYNIS